MLPKSVLDLFPAWEYLCPTCQAYVELPITACPNCKTSFNELKWRVPPRFLKSQKALSEYAHKVLAPKLSAEQRELLFKHFTIIFQTGFEASDCATLDFCEWTGTDGTPAITSGSAHHGTYKAVFDASAEDCYKEITPQTTIFTRVYVRLNALPGEWQAVSIVKFQEPNTDDAAEYKLIQTDVGYTIRVIRQFPAWAEVDGDVFFTPVINTWHLFEAKFVEHASAGEYRAYWEGTQVLADTGLDTSAAEGIGYVVVGQSSSDYTVTEWIDCVVVADVYIGPEVPPKSSGSIAPLMEGLDLL